MEGRELAQGTDRPTSIRQVFGWNFVLHTQET
jgi:hypothetical protein